MLGKILNLIEKGPAAPATALDSGVNRSQAAAAALLVEAARLDRNFDAEERAAINRIVREQFGLNDEEAQELLAVAEREEKKNYSDWIFIKTVQEAFSENEKKILLQSLWEVAYADASLHKLEIHLVQHVAKELGLSDADCEAARKTARGKRLKDQA